MSAAPLLTTPVCRRAWCDQPAACGPVAHDALVPVDDTFCARCRLEVVEARQRALGEHGPQRHRGYLR